jgi:hypothetical protein
MTGDKHTNQPVQDEHIGGCAQGLPSINRLIQMMRAYFGVPIGSPQMWNTRLSAGIGSRRVYHGES